MEQGTRLPSGRYQKPGAALAGAIEVVARYLRVSTKDQVDGYGLEVQDDNTLRYMNRREWIEYKVYSDEGVSGSLDHRPDMIKLEQDAHARCFTKILVDKVDRVGRTARAALNWAWRMKDIGVSFVAVQENIDTSTDMGWSMFQQYVFFSELEWNRIRERTQSGREKKISYGGWPGGPAPYGYRIEGIGRRGSYLVLNEAEVRVLRKAAELIISGLNIAQAAAELNLLGREYWTRSGKQWSSTNLYARMHSETFDGYVTYRKTHNSARKNTTKLWEDGTPVYGEPVKIAVPEIFMPEELKELRKAMQRTAFKNGRKADRGYPLSGRIHGSCGNTYTGGGRHDDRLYRCKGNTVKVNPCNDVYLPAPDMENAVWGKVSELLNDEGRLRALAEEWVSSLPGDAEKYREREKQLAADIKKKKTDIEVTVPSYIAAGVKPEVMKAAVTTMTEDLQKLEMQLEEVLNWLESYEQAKGQTDSIVALASKGVENLKDPDLARKADIFEMFDIQVYPESHRILQKGGVPCEVTAWHAETGTPVPADPTDEEWATIEGLLYLEFGSVHFSRNADVRGLLVKCLQRLRGGLSWTDLAPSYKECQRARERSQRWWKADVWPTMMEVLNAKGGGTPVFQRPTIPSLRVTGQLRGGLLAAMDKEGAREDPDGQGGPLTGLPDSVLSPRASTGLESPVSAQGGFTVIVK
jgi:DNA invertase Pin-like site-specific DNA recombinase